MTTWLRALALCHSHMPCLFWHRFSSAQCSLAGVLWNTFEPVWETAACASASLLSVRGQHDAAQPLGAACALLLHHIGIGDWRRLRALCCAPGPSCCCSHEEFPEDWFEGLHPDLYRATRYVTNRNKYKVQRCRSHHTLCSFLL